MSARVGSLYARVGYVLKEAHAALRAAMEAVLRPLDLTVAQYACMELLRRHPGLSNSELARGAFVSRQSMNVVIQGLEERGLVTRPTSAAAGRSLPTDLTAAGLRLIEAAAADVDRVEQQMLSPLTPEEQQHLLHQLARCAAALGSQRLESNRGTDRSVRRWST